MPALRLALLVLAIALLTVPSGLADMKFLGGNIINLHSTALKLDFNNDGQNDLALDPALRLGLLTMTPEANLHVAGNVLVQDWLLLSQISAEPAASPGRACLYVTGGNLSYKDASRSSVMSAGGTSSWTSASGNLYLATGKVGIGTSSPSANLHVLGSTRVSGRFLLASGNSSAPALAFASSTNTGLYHGTAGGNLGLAVGGSPKLILAGGNLVVQNADFQSSRSRSTSPNATNFFLGISAGNKMSSGVGCTLVGFQAGASITVYNGVVAFGYQALAGADVAYATVAGYKASGGSSTSAVGAFAGAAAPASAASLGVASLQNCTGSTGSVAIGYQALTTTTSGSQATALGAFAMQALTSGALNSAMGYCAMYSDTIGGRNNAFGSQALYACISGGNNTALGYGAGYNLTTGGNNVFAGSRAGYGLSSGGNNLLLGAQAGDNLTTGCNNVVIGYNQDAASATASDQLNIGGALYMNVGRVGIGTASPSANLQINGNVVCGNVLPATASANLGSPALTWNQVYSRHLDVMSDRRLKTDIQPLEYGLAEVRRLVPVRFAWSDGGGERIGFIAQDVAGVVPEAVARGGDPEGGLSLRAGSLLPVVVTAQKEFERDLALELAALCREITEQEELTRELEARLARLTRRSGR